MSITELYQALLTIGLPLRYSDFLTDDGTPPPDPPYLVYLFAYNNPLIADDHNVLDAQVFQIELYTDKKDLVNEKKVEDKLKEYHLPYNKTETRLDSEQMYQIVYEVEII